MHDVIVSAREKLYTSRFRSLVRRVGILHAVLRLYRDCWGFCYRLLYLLRRPKTAPLSIGPHKGIFIVESLAEFVRIRASGSEKKILARFLRELRPGDIAYDIGASIGIYTVLTAQAVGEAGSLVAFEPEPQSRERLLQNLALNGLDHIKVFDKGLGDKHEWKRLVLTGGSFTSGAHGFFYEKLSENGSPTASPEIEIVPGDQMISEMQLPLPQAVKIDVEGFEHEVLRGLRETLKKAPRCIILIEVHFSVLEKRGMADAPKKMRILLEEAGFTKFDWLDWSHLLATK